MARHQIPREPGGYKRRRDCSLEQGLRSKSVYRIETIKIKIIVQLLYSSTEFGKNRYGGDISRSYQKIGPLVPGSVLDRIKKEGRRNGRTKWKTRTQIR